MHGKPFEGQSTLTNNIHKCSCFVFPVFFGPFLFSIHNSVGNCIYLNTRLYEHQFVEEL